MRDSQIVAEGLSFPEGPVVMPDGSVIVVETFAGRITRCWNGKKQVVCDIGDGPNGGAIGPDGALYICNNGGIGPEYFKRTDRRGRIERVDLATGRFEQVYDSCDGKPLSAPNDLVFDCDGNLWFTDFGRFEVNGKQFGGLFCCRPDGSSIVQIAERATSFNGVGIAPDMRTVYVADTIEARIYTFKRELKMQTPSLHATVPGKVSLDSMAITAAGNVCVATIGATGAISTVTPGGEISSTPTADRVTTNIAFGGSDMRSAWITYSMRGMLVRMAWPESGLRLIYQ